MKQLLLEFNLQKTTDRYGKLVYYAFKKGFDNRIFMDEIAAGTEATLLHSRLVGLERNGNDISEKDKIEDFCHVLYVILQQSGTDPTPHEEYMQHIFRMIPATLQQGARIEDIFYRMGEALNYFHRAKQRRLIAGDIADIGRIKSLRELENLVDEQDLIEKLRDKTADKQEEEQRTKIAQQGAIEIVSTADYRILKLETKEAAIYYGQNTRWCTAGTTHNQFDYYNKQGPLYVIFDLKKKTKYQYHEESKQLKDVQDYDIDILDYPELVELMVTYIDNSDYLLHTYFTLVTELNFSAYRNSTRKAINNFLSLPNTSKSKFISILNYLFRSKNATQEQIKKFFLKISPSLGILYWRKHFTNDDIGLDEFLEAMCYKPGDILEDIGLIHFASQYNDNYQKEFDLQNKYYNTVKYIPHDLDALTDSTDPRSRFSTSNAPEFIFEFPKTSMSVTKDKKYLKMYMTIMSFLCGYKYRPYGADKSLLSWANHFQDTSECANMEQMFLRIMDDLIQKKLMFLPSSIVEEQDILKLINDYVNKHYNGYWKGLDETFIKPLKSGIPYVYKKEPTKLLYYIAQLNEYKMFNILHQTKKVLLEMCDEIANDAAPPAGFLTAYIDLLSLINVRSQKLEYMFLNYDIYKMNVYNKKATNNMTMYVIQYIRKVLKQPWPEAEHIIKSDPQSAAFYAINILKRPWPDGESIMKQDLVAWNDYKEEFKLNID